MLAAMLIAIAVLVVNAMSGSVRKVLGYVQGVPTLIALGPVGDGFELREDAAAAFRRMRAAMEAAGVWRGINSAFRDMAVQEYLYGLYLAGTGNLAAKPGYSNHQSGVAIDIDGCETFSTATYRWLDSNAAAYGFGNTGKSFKQPEPWHWEYKGV